MSLVIFLILSLVISSSSANTMSEELFRAQNELNIAFEFVELYLINQMDLWVGNMSLIIEDSFIPGFFKARGKVLNIIDETNEHINSINPSTCRDNVQRLWNRQVSQIGGRLQYCLRIAKGIAEQEFYEV